MPISIFLALFPLLLGLASAPAEAPQVSVQRMVIEQEWILRVQVRPQQLPQRFEWVESKGPKCVPAADIRGALLSGTDHVDFILPDRQRIRATFDDDCPALDFYNGLYLNTEDQKLCAMRDSVHSRIGGSCRIARFRKLTPKVKD
ncbi:MAG: hypothetical protein ABIT68_02470 [Sphingomicrobium sp.]